MRDLENKSRIYIKEFELDNLPAEENVELVFEGIDTLSDISILAVNVSETQIICFYKGKWGQISTFDIR